MLKAFFSEEKWISCQDLHRYYDWALCSCFSKFRYEACYAMHIVLPNIREYYRLWSFKFCISTNEASKPRSGPLDKIFLISIVLKFYSFFFVKIHMPNFCPQHVAFEKKNHSWCKNLFNFLHGNLKPHNWYYHTEHSR